MLDVTGQGANANHEARNLQVATPMLAPFVFTEAGIPLTGASDLSATVIAGADPMPGFGALIALVAITIASLLALHERRKHEEHAEN